MRLILLVFFTAHTGFAVATVHLEHCVARAAGTFGHDPKLIHAIIKVESGGNCSARSKKNTNGTYDIGCMQINSAWLPKLRNQFGITEAALYDPCTNIAVGSWILAKNKRQHGNTWRAIGAYNAASEHKRIKYAWKVNAQLSRMQ